MGSSHSFQANHRLRQERLQRNWRQREMAELLGTTSLSITRWERGTHQPSTYFRVKLCALFGKSAEDLGLIADAAPESQHPETATASTNNEAPSLFPNASHLWYIPYARNPCFTGRQEILKTVHTRMSASRPDAFAQAIALTGLGGIGKTQVAIEYAYQYAATYRAVFWLAAETAESLMTSLHHIAEQLQLPQRQAPEQSQMVAAVQHWLAMHMGWLLIGDNTEDPDLLLSVLPPLRQGTLLLTTRRQTLGVLAEVLEIPPMTREEGATLLLRRATQPGTCIQRDEPAPSQGVPPKEVTELVTLLEGLPLALDQAGAYIDETGCSIAAYLQLYYNQRGKVLAHRGAHAGTHPASVVATLDLAVEQIEQAHPGAADLLRVCAFLSPEAIPEELFAAGASYLGSCLEQIVTDPYQFDLALAALRNASLLRRHPETRTLSVHRLVQAMLLDQMEPEQAHRWSECVVRMINAAFPEPDIAMWEQCERIVAQALACATLIKGMGGTLSEAGELLFKVGSYLLARGRYKEAEPLLEHAVVLGKQQHGANHPLLMEWIEKQAELLWRQGQYQHTESLLRQVLALKEQHLGAEHSQTGETLNNLALIHWYQGRYTEAEPLYLRAWRIQEDHDPLLLADTLTNLGNLYRVQGRYAEAQPLFQRALRIQEELLGAEQYQLGLTLANFAILYQNQGKYAEAASLLKRARRIQEQQLGSDHPLTAFTYTYLANLYREQGKHEKAASLLKRARRTFQEQLGPDHPYTASMFYTLALLAQDQGEYAEAQRFCQQSLSIWEQQLGPEHSQTAFALTTLADLCRVQGTSEKAEFLYQRALGIREQQLGPDHPEIATTLKGLAALYWDQGNYERAEPLYYRALALCERQLGQTHPRTAEIRKQYESQLEQRKSATP